MSSYSFKSANNMGPIQFGSVFSGGTAPVVFGSNSPTATAFLSQIGQNPLMLLGIGALLLGGIYILANGKRGIKL